MSDSERGGGQLVRLCGLWKGTSQSGKPYYSGTIGDAKVYLFPNDRKDDGSNQPDLVLMLGRSSKPTGNRPASNGASAQRQSRAQASRVAAERDPAARARAEDECEIPF